jgi:hypothetical protein
MSDQLHTENRSALVGIASTIVFPYLWFSLFVLLWWLYNIGFFGRDWGGILMMVILGLVCLIPAVPLALTRFVVRPVFSNLLAHEIISHAGCVTGLVSIILAGFVTVYILSRGGFETALLLLLAAPVVGALLSGGVSLLTRGGSLHLSGRGRAKPGPPATTVEKPMSSVLPGARKPPMVSATDQPALPTTQSRPSALPAPRRSGDRPTPSRPAEHNSPPARRPAPPHRKP